ncbi:hypothetical protein A1O7_09469 [Cladophialophora yegresii CBS 114405]|uniref:Uncharacterized protein n=1 Tax=Cladophialophora yegresii CBS 114405 TaxID=1182544 RepID=W9VET1_9EURO|nr:uncharacterized protein A1O7_09469 [Cladophialophora yegresii CBS 114405]EXJ54132.1 hypothetical protein A1O7_09469 [Cladophialophora yegresii CBS 114405]
MTGSKTLILTSTYPSGFSPRPTAHERLRRRFITILHGASWLASLIAISLFAAAIPAWNKNFFHSTGPNRGDWTDGMSLGPLTFAMLYHAVVLIRGRMRKAQRSDVSTSYCPSLSQPSLIIHITVPCLVLLSLLPALFLAAYGSLFRFWQPAKRTQSGILVCNMLNIFARECEPTLYDIGSLQIAGITFGILVWIFHFALLLVGLRQLRRARLAKQLQREKMAQYARGEERSSRRSRRGYGRAKGSTDRDGAGDHGAWHQHPRPDRYQRSGSSSSSNSKSRSGSQSGSRSNSLVGGVGEAQRGRTEASPQGERQLQNHQEVPIFFIQAPDASHAPTSRRPG